MSPTDAYFTTAAPRGQGRFWYRAPGNAARGRRRAVRGAGRDDCAPTGRAFHLSQR